MKRPASSRRMNVSMGVAEGAPRGETVVDDGVDDHGWDDDLGGRAGCN